MHQSTERTVSPTAQRLSECFQDDGFFGEETGGEPEHNFWLIDPIDGTSNFMTGLDYWCIAMAYVVDGHVAIGLVYVPLHDTLYWAVAGQGSFCGDKPLRCRDVSDLSEALLLAGHSQRRKPRRFLRFLERTLGLGAAFKVFGSCALSLCHVAEGRADAYYESHVNAWDCLAACLILREAGGRVNDFLRGEGLRKGGPVLGAAPALWPELREIAELADTAA